MNQLAVVNQPGGALSAQPEYSIRDMERIAVAFSASGLFGVKTPDQALALCLIAHAEGRHPALAARDYDIIDGKPSKKAEAMQRDFIAAGGKIEWTEMSDARCAATFSHPLGGSVSIDWDMDRAKKAGLGGKQNWQKYPRAMLRSRTVSEGVRAVFPTATSGMYVPEEVIDFDDKPSGPAVPQAKRARDLKAEPADSVRAKAETWVAEQLAAVESVSDLEALDTIIAGGNRAVTKLAREHADLHKQVQDAYESKAQELQGYANDGTLSADNPTAAEGPADEQRDEAQSLREAIAAASDLAALDELQERFAEAKKRLIGNDITAIRGLLADRRNELA